MRMLQKNYPKLQKQLLILNKVNIFKEEKKLEATKKIKEKELKIKEEDSKRKLQIAKTNKNKHDK